MSSAEQQQQDQPGPEWAHLYSDPGTGDAWEHAVLGYTMAWGGFTNFGNDPKFWRSETRSEAIARCRAISEAALAWEVAKRDALAVFCGTPGCGGRIGIDAHHISCPHHPSYGQ